MSLNKELKEELNKHADTIKNLALAEARFETIETKALFETGFMKHYIPTDVIVSYIDSYGQKFNNLLGDKKTGFPAEFEKDISNMINSCEQVDHDLGVFIYQTEKEVLELVAPCISAFEETVSKAIDIYFPEDGQ